MHSCSESFSDHAASRFAANAKLTAVAAQTLRLLYTFRLEPRHFGDIRSLQPSFQLLLLVNMILFFTKNIVYYNIEKYNYYFIGCLFLFLEIFL